MIVEMQQMRKVASMNGFERREKTSLEMMRIRCMLEEIRCSTWLLELRKTDVCTCLCVISSRRSLVVLDGEINFNFADQYIVEKHPDRPWNGAPRSERLVLD